MDGSTKPKRVVIVDADNPLEEIQGEFFWREDHDRLVEAARAEGFKSGYASATREAEKLRRDSRVVRLRRRPSPVRCVIWLLVAVAVVAYGLDLVNR